MSKKNQLFTTFRKYIYAIISTALVLLIIGLYGVLLLFGREAVNSVKENLEVIVELTATSTEAEHTFIQNLIKNQIYTKPETVQFISKEEGLKKLEKQFGDDLINFDFDNPLFDLITFNLTGNYAQSDSLKAIKLNLLENNNIQDIHYQNLIVADIEQNSKKIGWVILIISSLLLIIAVVLINNTVRLALNDNRFIIKNMQYVGATEGFIIKPYLQKAILNAFISSTLAITAILSIMYFLNQQVPDLFSNTISAEILFLFAIVLIISFVISITSTFIAVRRFLRKSTDKLY
ncbi:MAG: cell division transport system permease protein [Saprospiraceae bacterium]|jgi:cell division transport system permease protein